MKRVYHKEKRSEAQRHAMELYLETRAKIKKDNPGLLSSIRERLLNERRGDQIKIDRQKNLKAINKMMDLSNRSSEFQNKIQKIILSAGA